eukprot:g14895.t1
MEIAHQQHRVLLSINVYVKLKNVEHAQKENIVMVSLANCAKLANIMMYKVNLDAKIVKLDGIMQLLGKKVAQNAYSATGNELCTACPKGRFTKILGQTKCFTCPRPETCAGDGKCVKPWNGKACTTCEKNYYFVDKNTCLKCPESDVGIWILVIILIPSVSFIVYIFMRDEYEKDETNDDISGNARDQSRRKSRTATTLSKYGKARKNKNTRKGKAPVSISASVFAKHSLNLSFMMPLLKLIYVPQEFRDLLKYFLSLVTIDLSGIVSSPECSWEIDVTGLYIIKIVCPVIFFLSGTIWYMLVPLYVKQKNRLASNKSEEDMPITQADKEGLESLVTKSREVEEQQHNHKAIRAIQNRLFAVGSFLWLTTLYPLTAYQTLSALDCTNQGDSTYTLDLDPSIDCDLENTTFRTLFILAVIFVPVYCLLSILLLVIKYVHACSCLNLPTWTDVHNCKNYDGRPCGECYDCDQRQRFAWIFRRYKSDVFYWEYLIICHKLLLMMVSLFFTNNFSMALPFLIAINSIYIVLICYFQPYLTDDEYFLVYQIGRDAADKFIDRKRCSKRGCGANSMLDATLFLGELFILIAALIVHQSSRVKETMEALRQDTNATNASHTNVTITGPTSALDTGGYGGYSGGSGPTGGYGGYSDGSGPTGGSGGSGGYSDASGPTGGSGGYSGASGGYRDEANVVATQSLYRVEQIFPKENGFAAALEITGITIYALGFLLLIKTMFTWCRIKMHQIRVAKMMKKTKQKSKKNSNKSIEMSRDRSSKTRSENGDNDIEGWKGWKYNPLFKTIENKKNQPQQKTNIKNVNTINPMYEKITTKTQTNMVVVEMQTKKMAAKLTANILSSSPSVANIEEKQNQKTKKHAAENRDKDLRKVKESASIKKMRAYSASRRASNSKKRIKRIKTFLANRQASNDKK